MRRLKAARTSASIVFAAFLMALLLPGCGGGGGGDSDSVVCSNVAFDRAMVSPVGGDVYMDQSSSSCSTLDVVILVSNLTGIFTVGFDLAYPINALEYQSYSLGPLILKGNPSTTPFVLVSPTPGGIQVSVTRFGPDAPVAASGSEALLSLRFRRLGGGAGSMDFDTSLASPVGETVLDQNGQTRPASFAPGHGGMVTIP